MMAFTTKGEIIQYHNNNCDSKQLSLLDEAKDAQNLEQSTLPDEAKNAQNLEQSTLADEAKKSENSELLPFLDDAEKEAEISGKLPLLVAAEKTPDTARLHGSGWLFSWRSFIVIILHASYMLTVLPIYTLPVALICMCGPVRPSNLTDIRLQPNPSNTNLSANVSRAMDTSSYSNVSSIVEQKYEFDWSPELRGLLISSASFCQFLVPPLADLVRGYLGNKLTLTLITASCALCYSVCPLAARVSVYFLLGVVILSGLTQGGNGPVSSDTLAWWLPEREKLSAASFVMIGRLTGGILPPLISGYFCLIPGGNGWPFIFYFNAFAMASWALLWFCFSSQKPEKHRFISERERDYIVTTRLGLKGSHSQRTGTPYVTVLTSRAVLAFLLSATCYTFPLQAVPFSLPFYLTSVLRFSLQESGIFVTALSLIRLVVSFLWIAVGNWLMSLQGMTTNRSRKISLGIGQSLTCVFFLGASLFDHTHKWLAGVLLVSGTAASTLALTMLSVLPLDMAPRYAGFISAILGLLAGLVSVVAPIVVTSMTTHGSYEEWRLLWVIMGLTHLLGGLIFVCLGSASIQPWALQEKEHRLDPLPTKQQQMLGQGPDIDTSINKTEFRIHRKS